MCRLKAAEADVDFSREVLPLLSENCFHCHGPDAGERKADLRLDVAGKSNSAINPGNPVESALVERVSSSDPDEIMPPPDSGKKLTAGQKKALTRWIASGAKYEAHWAFQALNANEPPAIKGKTLTPIDRFIVSALEKQSLSLSEPLSKTQLIRRATFDLTGLPPTWSDVENFIKDESPDAFAKIIDRLLESKAYGERWGRHWLDLARYADTHGGSAIGFKRFPFSYTYRDYVIAAFNDDLPYDRFITEQLAADQLKLEENDPALAALGFLTVGRQYRNIHDRLDDQIDVISRGLLGLTVSCARCHDHKFDPIPTTDYYALHATLSSSRKPNDLPLVGDSEVNETYLSALQEKEAKLKDLEREQGAVFRSRLRMQTGMYLKELASGTPEQDTSTFFLSYRTEDLRPIVLERWREYLKSLDDKDPVFGPWHQLSKIDPKEFGKTSQTLIQKLIKENGDPKKFENDHQLTTVPPPWNPKILNALAEKNPNTFPEVADIYGEVFSTAQKEWMSKLLDASLEAAPGGEKLKDQDQQHRTINSAIERQLRHHLHAGNSPTSVDLADPDNVRVLNRGLRDKVGGARGAIHNLNLTANAPPRAMVLKEEENDSRESFVLLRGNPTQRGERVEPAFLTAISGSNRKPFAAGQRRLDLARAIVAQDNPLTRRVIANWVWQHHFGKGLVLSSDDFGTRGDPPTHPALLDYLASKVLEDGWSLKKIHKRIMMSASYQQASIEKRVAREKDPTNQLLWRMPPRRLEMEAMRDSLLAVSGELDPTAGGQPFEEKGEKAIPRRSVYAFLNRDVIPPMVATFDGADPSACTVKRQETMVPQQTLFALNSTYVQDRAAALMKLDEIANAKSDQDRIKRIYQRVYSRNPLPGELETALQFIAPSGESKPGLWKQLAHALIAANEFHFVD